MSRKYEPIDLMKLYSSGSVVGWNKYLNECLAKRDINALAKLRYRIGVGMTDLANQKLNTPDIDYWFTRLQKSIENTARQIIRIKLPLPGDNSLLPLQFRIKHNDVKQKRDQELAKFLKDSSF